MHLRYLKLYLITLALFSLQIPGLVSADEKLPVEVADVGEKSVQPTARTRPGRPVRGRADRPSASDRDELPPAEQRLMWILLSFAEITPTIEAWGTLNFYRACEWDKFPPMPECDAI